ncbi:MAG TPA: hypothetical protein VKA48_02600, partial [Gammaproteobacteria bacterium]|nr:hypothetical protein [Gammaproteobacteria bacterium]
TTLTLTQSGCAYLMDGVRRGRGMSQAGLEARVLEEVEVYGSAGAAVDPGLQDPLKRGRRIEDFLRFGQRQGLLETGRGDKLRVREQALGKPDPWHRQGLIPYGANEHQAFTRYWSQGTYSRAQDPCAVRIEE